MDQSINTEMQVPIRRAICVRVQGTLDVGLERAKSEGAAYYAKLKETLPSPSTQDVKQGTQVGVDVSHM